MRLLLLFPLLTGLIGCGQPTPPPAPSAAPPPPAVSSNPPRLKDAQDGRRIDPVATSLVGHPIPVVAVKTLAFDPAGTRLAAGDGAGNITVWHMPDGKHERTFKAHGNWAFSIAFHPDGKVLASGGGDNLIRFWDVATGNKIRELQGHTEDLHGVAYIEGGKSLASGSDDKLLMLWDIEHEKYRAFPGHERQITHVAASPDGKQVATTSRDATARIWKADSGELVYELKGHEKDVLAATYSPDGQSLATASYDGTLMLWDVATGKPLRTLKAHTDWVFAVAYHPDGTVLASGAKDKTLRLWNAKTGGETRREEFDSDVSSVVFSPDGNNLAVATSQGQVWLIPFESGKLGERKLLGVALKRVPTQSAVQSSGASAETGETAPPSSATSKQASNENANRNYVALHHVALDPAARAWSEAVSKLATEGDGFTVEQLELLDASKLTSEKVELIKKTTALIKARIGEENAATLVPLIQPRLERAASVDLGCDMLEGTLVPWTLKSIRPFKDTAVVRDELDRIRLHYEPPSDAPLATAKKARVREYASRLLGPGELNAKPAGAAQPPTPAK